MRAKARIEKNISTKKSCDKKRNFWVERMMGVGPTSQAWEARILPMYYTRIFNSKLLYIPQAVIVKLFAVFLRK